MTNLYRLEVPSRNWIERTTDWYQEQPTHGKVLTIVAAPLIAATIAFIGPEAGVVSALAVGASALFGAGDDPSYPPITELDMQQASAYRDPLGNPLSATVTYASHPHTDKTLVPVTQYHSTILKEQAADLVEYVRSIVPATKITVGVDYSRASNAKIGSGGFFDLERKKMSSNKIVASASYVQARIVPQSRELPWISAFSAITAGLRGASAGRLSFVQQLNANVSYKAEMARKVGFEIRSEDTYDVNIDVVF